MNRRNLILVLLLCGACMFLGVSFGAQVFGCQQDELDSDHVFFRANECFQSSAPDGTKFLECRRVAGGAK
jgi:hypothetical protein